MPLSCRRFLQGFKQIYHIYSSWPLTNGLYSGFSHSAFTFGKECHVAKSHEKFGKSIGAVAGALVQLIQKGLQYIELEANDAEVGSPSHLLKQIASSTAI